MGRDARSIETTKAKVEFVTEIGKSEPDLTLQAVAALTDGGKTDATSATIRFVAFMRKVL